MRKINVKVVPNARENRIVDEKDLLKVYLKAPPKKGEANKLLIRLLADYYNISKDRVRISHGLTSRRKTIEISD